MWARYLEYGLAQLCVMAIRGFTTRYQQVSVCLHATCESQSTAKVSVNSHSAHYAAQCIFHVQMCCGHEYVSMAAGMHCQVW